MLAAEHVEVLMAEPDHVADGIRNAGALFIGRYAPTVVGDYFAGPSHVLANRTDRTFFFAARCAGFHEADQPHSLFGPRGRTIWEMIERFAMQEGLTGHARSIAIRRHQA